MDELEELLKELGTHADEIPQHLLNDIDALRRLVATLKKADSFLLPNEVWEGYSIYQIYFSDGCAYIGQTRQLIADRIEQHFGQQGPNPFGSNINVFLHSKKYSYEVTCLASGLSEYEARLIERKLISNLKNALNSRYARHRPTNCSLMPNSIESAGHGAVAEFYRRQDP